MYIDNASSPTVTNVTFSGNWAIYGGGMYNNGNSSPTVTNVTFSDNTADDSGGGMFNNGSSPTVTNVTFSANKATRGNGGGMSNNWSSNVTIRNAIFWGNTPAAQIYNDSSTTVVSDSVVQNGYAGGTNIITADPLLGTLGNYGGFTQTIRLLPGSSAIDAGDDTVSICDGDPADNFDQRGFTRPQGAHCDIGAYELEVHTLTYTAGANGSITGASPQTVHHGASGTQVTAVPNAGYHFVKWSDNSTANPRTDTNVTGNINVTATFAINTHTLTYSAGANGSITGASPQTVNHGANGTQVTAVPDANYHFVDWSDGITTASRTDTNVTADKSVTANFARDNQAPTDISLSASSINENLPIGTTVGTLSTTDSNAGDTFTYSFACFTPGVNDGSFTITANSLKTAAKFNYEVKKNYAICIRATDSGGLFYDKNFTITVTDVNEQTAKNGGFNLYPAGKIIPTSWTAALFATTDGKDMFIKKEGTASVKIAGATGKAKTLTQTLMMSGPLGDTFTFSYYTKADKFPAAGICQAQVLFYSGTTLKGTKTLKCPTGTTYTWKQANLNFTAPKAYTKVVIKFTYSKASGTVWFDAVSLLR